MRAPDLNAPRFRFSVIDPLTKGMIAKFKLKYPQYRDYTTEELIAALNLHNEAIAKEISISRDGVELQSTLGYLFIGMVPSSKKRPPVAWAKSIKLGVKVIHKNWNTDGLTGKVFYFNYGSRYRIENKHLWGFSTARPLKLLVKDEMRGPDWRKFLVMDSRQKNWKTLSAANYKQYMKETTKKNLPSYNEFEM